jgi:hypothetical protein
LRRFGTLRGDDRAKYRVTYRIERFATSQFENKPLEAPRKCDERPIVQILLGLVLEVVTDWVCPTENHVGIVRQFRVRELVLLRKLELLKKYSLERCTY